jgi:hypothetical protein
MHLPLSAIDHVYASPAIDPIPFVLRYGAELDPDRVVAAFWETAHDFLGVAGTLAAVDDHTLAFDLSRDRADVQVLCPEPGVSASSLVEPLVTTVGGPLARAYVIHEPGGSTSIALNMAHVVADGYGYLLFMIAWAARARGADAPSPNCDRSILSAPQARTAGARRFPPGNLPHSGFVLLERDARAPRLRFEERMRSVSGAEWQRGPGSQRVSFNDLLCASLWKEMIASEPDELTTFICYVDIRRHVPRLGPLYFGNAILSAAVTEVAGVVRASPVAELASRIRDAVRAVPERIGAALAELETLRAAHGLEVVPRLRTFSPSGLAVTNMSRAPFAAVDFGAGPPIGIDLAAEPPRCRGCVVLPAGEQLKLIVATP